MPALKGIDVSLWQGAIDWPRVKEDGFSFALIKASEGLSVSDPQFVYNWAGAKAAGLVRGAYCFTRPELGDAAGQAAHFVQTVVGQGDWLPGDLAAGDFETPEGSTEESAFVLAFLRTCEAAAGFRPLLYSNQDWALHRLTDTRLAAYPLWLACPGEACPASIGVWPYVALAQFSWTLSVPGITGDVDGDELARSLDGLRALGRPATRLKTTVDCALKQAPDHLSRRVVLLTAGVMVGLDGLQTPHWIHCHTSHYSGWLLKADLEAA